MCELPSLTKASLADAWALQPNALQLGQSRHEELIRSHLERYGVEVEFGTELLDFTQDEDKVHVRLTKSDVSNVATEEFNVPFLVGADGGRSKVRKTLGLRFEGETRELDKIVVGDIVVKPPGVALDVSVSLWSENDHPED